MYISLFTFWLNMRKLYRNIRAFIIITILISVFHLLFLNLTPFASSLGKQRYSKLGAYKYLWSRITAKDTEQCHRQKQEFWKTEVRDQLNMTKFTCLHRDKNKTGVFSYFISRNFKGVKCEVKTIEFAKHNMKQIALASFPGSGNTWYRHLIEDVTGVATGSQYCSRRLIRTFIGECQKDTSNIIALKTHGRAHRRSESKYEKAILIIRNPYDAILAEFNRGESMNKTAIVDRSAFESKKWADFVSEISPHWRSHTLRWLKIWDGPLHISYYEKMKSNFYEELYGVIDFLEVKVTFRDVWCAGVNRDGQFLREKPDWLKPSVLYSPELQTVVNTELEQVQNLAKLNVNGYIL